MTNEQLAVVLSGYASQLDQAIKAVDERCEGLGHVVTNELRAISRSLHTDCMCLSSSGFVAVDGTLLDG